MAAAQQPEQVYGGGLAIVKPPEGQMLTVVKSNKDGPLDYFVLSLKGHHFWYQEYSNDPDDVHELDETQKWEIRPNREGRKILFTPQEGDILEREFGTIVVGPGRALKIPSIHYTKWELGEDGVEWKLVRKDRSDSPFFYYEYTMGIPVLNMETAGNVKVSFHINVMGYMLNPALALFLSGGWETVYNAAIHGIVRQIVGPLDLDEIRTMKESGAHTLKKAIIDLNEGKRGEKGLHQEIGFVTGKVNILGFEIEDPVKEAATAEMVAKLDARAAKHTAKKIKQLGEATNEVARGAAAAYGPEGAARVQESQNLRDAVLGNTVATTIVLGGNAPPIALNNQPGKQSPPHGQQQGRGGGRRQRGRKGGGQAGGSGTTP